MTSDHKEKLIKVAMSVRDDAVLKLEVQLFCVLQEFILIILERLLKKYCDFSH